MKYSRRSVVEIFNSVEECLKVKEIKVELKYALARDRSRFRVAAEESAELHKALNERAAELRVKYCKKNADDKPVIKEYPLPDGQTVQIYEGLSRGLQPEYDVEMKKINDLVAALMKEEVEVDPYLIKQEYVDKAVPGDLMAGFFKLIVLDEKEPEKK
jgi:hypothetical protein